MKVGDLVRAPDILGERRLGLVMDAENDENDTPGYWVEFFEDFDTWKWYASDNKWDVEMISESR